MKFSKSEFDVVKRYIRSGSFKNIKLATDEPINFSTILEFDDTIRQSKADVHRFNMLRWDYIIDEFAVNEKMPLKLLKRLINRVYGVNEKRLLKYLLGLALITNICDDEDECNDYYVDIAEDVNDKLKVFSWLGSSEFNISDDTVADCYIRRFSNE